MITITYFGNLKDQLHCNEESIAWESGDTEQLLMQLRARDEAWNSALAPEKIFRVVVNDEIIFTPVALKSGDRVAFLPPVTGG
ncbi:MoaD/ThiS family protein [Ignatzschineria larvae DSM 13226]|uniref:MoaD/ThiS family protein n=1 Tax=Ignatzschineria larvae DSM 13226 TaxID=1111732 RepID=A0ABZ3C2Z3_9GAMM|nr:MoaD/ThiS family protein [Ignatzschineria larvae]